MSGQHCENYDVKREIVHYYPRNVDCCCRDQSRFRGGVMFGWNLSAFFKFAFVLLCYITNRLMTGPLGNSEFCFPRINVLALFIYLFNTLLLHIQSTLHWPIQKTQYGWRKEQLKKEYKTENKLRNIDWKALRNYLQSTFKTILLSYSDN